MKAQELRNKFISFFEAKEHKLLPSSSLIPQDDPSVLLTTAGMQQFKKWFTGIEKPMYPRVVTIQKCVRVDDIEEVGDNTHLSFFEMLGNFAFDDYFKKEAIEWGIEFITKELGVEKTRIEFTYFEGSSNLPEDTESLEILKNIMHTPQEKIKGMGMEDNFWGPTGDEGPCGPTVEIYVDGIEVWNLVFNQFYKTRDGKYENLNANGIDTGAGFERLMTILNKVESLYDTDLFSNTILKVKDLADSDKLSGQEHSTRVIADHLRTACFLIADGVIPSNLDKGYILRRLIRRAIRHGKLLNIKDNFTSRIAEVIIADYKEAYPQLEKNKGQILGELEKEEDKFKSTLEKGLMQFEKKTKGKNEIDGKNAFDLFQSYGFPLEMTKELAEEKGMTVYEKEYNEEFEKHQELSRKGAENKFKGGLETGGEQETKYHTATHLLHQALRAILGDHVKQAGSNITAERLRFDFTHPEKLLPEQVQEVENLVNEQIKAAFPVVCEEMTVEDAKEKGAIGLFESKYSEKVKVYTIGDKDNIFSMEICGGPHVSNTNELGVFKIIKEEASSAGVRRIKAILK